MQEFIAIYTIGSQINYIKIKADTEDIAKQKFDNYLRKKKLYIITLNEAIIKMEDIEVI